MTFDEAFEKVLGNEGGYTNNPADPGGETMWGITKAVAVAHGYTGAMEDMTQDTAKSIYKPSYWDAIKADQMPAEIRFDVFDAAVNSGPLQAVKWLQQAIGATPDGVVGPATLAALKGVDGAQLSKRINAQRLRFMTALKTWPVFSIGWVRRIANNLEV